MVPPLQPDSRDLRFLTQLAALGGRQVGAAEVFENLGFSRILPLLEIGNPSAASVLRYAAEAVETIIGAGAIRLAASHGDYTPWNTLRLDDGSLFVFDWEYGDEAAPVLNDAFHYLFLPAMLVRRQPVVSVVERLLALHRHPLFGVLTSGVEQRHLPAYLLLYLVQLALRQQACEGRVSELTHRALRAALARCGHSRLRKNVLVAAYACEPNAGSEPGVGWNMCQAISRDNEAWVITRRNNRQRIEAALATTPNPHLHFVYADLPRWASFWKKGSRGIRAYYYLWQFAAWWQARRLRDVPFDLAHHITFVNSYMFSFLGLLRVPFVWGPLGSNPDWPTQLVPDLAHRFRHGLRQRARRILPVFDPLYWLCTARARLIIGINADVASVPVSLLAKRKFLCHPAIGVEEALLGARRVEAMPSTFNVLSMGRLIPVKGYHLTLRAFAELVKTEAAARLTIVGAGIEKRRLQALVESLGLEGKVCFVPWLPRADALAIMNSADAFLFPSLEGAGMVVLEAMAQGLPVVCLDYGGPGQMVDRECGFAVPVGTLQSTIEQLALALKTLARDSGLRSRMASAARRRIAACYLWERRHEAISVWYERAIRADGPPLS
jgi:glycosyltransferase involved in cell wall biosynthesis